MDLVEAIMTRRSIRKFIKAPVEEEKITELLKAAMAAPSAGNRQKALELMADKCPDGFDIIREEESSIGRVISGETTKTRDAFDGKVESREYTVKTRFEWRMYFRCN